MENNVLNIFNIFKSNINDKLNILNTKINNINFNNRISSKNFFLTESEDFFSNGNYVGDIKINGTITCLKIICEEIENDDINKVININDDDNTEVIFKQNNQISNIKSQNNTNELSYLYNVFYFKDLLSDTYDYPNLDNMDNIYQSQGWISVDYMRNNRKSDNNNLLQPDREKFFGDFKGNVLFSIKNSSLGKRINHGNFYLQSAKNIELRASTNSISYPSEIIISTGDKLILDYDENSIDKSYSIMDRGHYGECISIINNNGTNKSILDVNNNYSKSAINIESNKGGILMNAEKIVINTSNSENLNYIEINDLGITLKSSENGLHLQYNRW